MPQLDFIWWMMKFFLIWMTTLTVLTILISSKGPSSTNQLSSSPKIQKETTEWQWP